MLRGKHRVQLCGAWLGTKSSFPDMANRSVKIPAISRRGKILFQNNFSRDLQEVTWHTAKLLGTGNSLHSLARLPSRNDLLHHYNHYITINTYCYYCCQRFIKMKPPIRTYAVGFPRCFGILHHFFDIRTEHWHKHPPRQHTQLIGGAIFTIVADLGIFGT